MAYNRFEAETASMFLALEDACKKIEKRAQEDVTKRELLFKKQLDDFKADEAKKQLQLQSEISALKGQVASLTSDLEKARAIQQQRPVSRVEQHMPVGGIVKPSTNGDRRDTEHSPTELQRDLEKARSRYEAVKKQLEMTVSLARKRKTEVLNWVKYADSLEQKIKKMEKKKTARSSAHQSTGDATTKAFVSTDVPAEEVPNPERPQPGPQISDAFVDPPKELADHGPSRPDFSTSFMSTSSFATSFGPRGDRVIENDKDPYDDVQLPSRKAVSSPSIRQDDADTVNGTFPGESTQGEPSSDDGPSPDPRLPTLPMLSTSGGEVNDDVAIKKEPSSDGPEVVWERPAKRTRRDVQEEEDRQPQTPQLTATVKRESSGSTWSGAGLLVPASQESIDLDEGQLAMPTPRKRQLVYHDVPSPESPGTTGLDRSAIWSLAEADRTPRPSPSAAVLTPLSVNTRRAAKGNGKEKKGSARAARQLKRGADSLNEDNGGRPAAGGQANPPSTAKAARLHSLLNSRPVQPSPILPVLRATVQTMNSSNSPISGAFGEPPPVRTLPQNQSQNQKRDGTPASRYTKDARTETGLLSSVTTTPKTREAGRRIATPLTEALRAAAAENASRKGSLRGRGVDRLKLDDFKVNPAWNDGETFAFSEVVRSRTDRGHLAGCTDPQCCGKAFRGMAESELSASGPGHIARPDSVAMMERYLGDEAFVLARLSPDEKKELWLKAKTKQLSDKYGKHRHRYHRRASPPGFWDADFPTTQEEERNRAESERAERAIVQERYREAMRPNGQWLFRDE